MSTQREELRVECGVPTRAANNSRFEIIEDDFLWAATVKLQCIGQASIELAFSLRESELDIAHPRIAQDCDKDRDFADRVVDLDRTDIAPVNLDGFAWTVDNVLIDPSLDWPNRSKVGLQL